MRSDNKKAVVFGASAGLGREVAVRLSQVGVRVAMVARNEERLQKAADEISQVPVVGDLDTPDGVVNALKDVREAIGEVDILVTNQGGPPQMAAVDASPEDFELQFQRMHSSVVAAARLVLPHMLKQRWGRIICITSIASKEPVEGLVLSNVVRAGIHAYAKTISREVAAAGVTVNCVMPGYTRTGRLADLGVDLGKLAQKIPRGEVLGPESLGSLIAFLATDEAEYITGQSFAVDGGQTQALF